MNGKKWLSTWGTAPSYAERSVSNYTKDVTLRYVIRSAFDGNKIRLTFSNVCNDDTATINCVTVALTGSDPCSIDTNTLKAVTFNQSKSFTMNADDYVQSDEIDFSVKKGQDISVSFYIKDLTPVNCGTKTSGYQSLRFFTEGDRTHEENFPTESKHVEIFYRFLNTVDVLTDVSNRSYVAYGDSITTMEWPEILHQLCLDNQKDTAIVRRAISGSRILRQYDALSYKQYGPTGIKRFPKELDQSASDTVIVLHGINDIIHPDGINPLRPMSHFPCANDLIEGLRVYIRKAHENKMKIFLCTLMPIEGWRTYAEFRDTVRCELNEWIRTQNEADGFIDLDLALRDHENPKALCPAFDKGDHLHPSYEGSKAIAEAVYKVLFE